jgi:hypothetical protein
MKTILAVLILGVFKLTAQTGVVGNAGFSAGLTLNFGTHINSLGLSLKGYYFDHFFQLNGGSAFSWNFSNFGERQGFWESRNYIGAVLLGGKKDNTRDFQLEGVFHQTGYRNAVGYAHIWYFDSKGTSQRSGAWGGHFHKWSFYFENDLFAGQGKDRFRTGHLYSSYRTNVGRVGAGIYLWTGETNGAVRQQASDGYCKYGYKDLSALPFGRTGHGIMYAAVSHNMGYGQVLSGKIGIDSERFRDLVQNRIIHDLPFLPKFIPRHTPHYPPLDAEGFPVFDQEKIRRSTLFFQAGANE